MNESEMIDLKNDRPKTDRLLNYRNYLRQRPMLLALLSVLTILFFLAVAGLSKAYHDQRESLGNRWFNRGVADLNAKRFDAAVTDLRAALLYSPDNYSYQLNLAEALIGMKQTEQASAYLLNLWERQPEDGMVNLELARIAAEKGETEQAIRYYHNAVYAAWPPDQESKRLDARLELIELLLRNNQRAQAESEIIALEANVGDEPALLARLGDFFVRTLDFERAFTAYRASLKPDRRNAAALAGAGRAAFELGHYPLAYKYLQEAVAANSDDAKSAALLKTAELVLHLDPFQRPLSMAQRNRIVLEDFAIAGRRLPTCNTPAGSAQPSMAQPSLADAWAKMKPQITELGLQRRPDLVEQAMELVFNIERQTGNGCGAPTLADQALQLIAKLHEGN